MTTKKHPDKLQNKVPNPPPNVRLIRGRPSIYSQDMDEHVRRLCLLGLSDAEIAQYLGITPQSMCDWDKAHPSFLQARDEGRDIADAEVAESLRKRAIGYSHPAEKIFIDKSGEIVRAPYTEHYPPDTGAAALWLSNRQRARWRLKQPGDEDKGDGQTTIVINGGLPR